MFPVPPVGLFASLLAFDKQTRRPAGAPVRLTRDKPRAPNDMRGSGRRDRRRRFPLARHQRGRRRLVGAARSIFCRFLEAALQDRRASEILRSLRN